MDNWTRNWLRKKQFCFNPGHELYHPAIDRIIKDLNSGQNVIIIVVGRGRSGKSRFSLWLQCFLNWCYFGREEYNPSDPNNLAPLKDLYWKLDDFIDATKDPINMNKFITQEEQGVENYSKDFYMGHTQNYDKLTQIFGVDLTNPIINLPMIADLSKGTRGKAHFLFRCIKKSKKRVIVIPCEKSMSITTDKISWRSKKEMFESPDIEKIFPKFVAEYESLKLKYNKDKKDELTAKRNKPTGKPFFTIQN